MACVQRSRGGGTGRLLLLLLLAAVVVATLARDYQADSSKDDHHHKDKDDDHHKGKDDDHHHKGKDDDHHKGKDDDHHKSDRDDKERHHRRGHHHDDGHHKEGGHHHRRGRHDHHKEDKAAEDDPHHYKEYDELDSRLNKLTSRLQEMSNELDDRLDPKKVVKAQSLEHRVAELEEDLCDKDHYYCGREDPECVSRLHVCDGINDCRSGDDEKHCDLPTKVGDTFEGHVVFDNCTQRRPDTISFTITAVKVEPSFTAFPKVRATIDISKDTDHHEGEASLPTVGYYRFATQNLILLPPEEDRLGLICDFDGHNPDRCVGNIVRESSLEPCAQFIFFRTFDDDEEDDDHHESHYHH